MVIQNLLSHCTVRIIKSHYKLLTSQNLQEVFNSTPWVDMSHNTEPLVLMHPTIAKKKLFSATSEFNSFSKAMFCVLRHILYHLNYFEKPVHIFVQIRRLPGVEYSKEEQLEKLETLRKQLRLKRELLQKYRNMYLLDSLKP